MTKPYQNKLPISVSCLLASRSIWLSALVLVFLTTPLMPQKAELVVQMGHALQILACDFSHDDRLVASGGADGEAILWETATGREIKRFNGHDGGVDHVLFVPGDQQLLTASSDDGTACLWDIRSGIKTRCFEDKAGINAVAFSRNGEFLATAGGKTARLWNIRTGAAVAAFEDPDNVIASLTFSPDGNNLLTGNVGGYQSLERKGTSARLWDIKSKVLVRSYTPAPHVTDGPNGVIDYYGIYSVAFIKNGKFILIGDTKPETVYTTFYQKTNPTQPILMFETDSARFVRSIPGSSPFTVSDNDADFLAAGGDAHSSSSYLRNGDTGREIMHFEGFMLDAELEAGVVDALVLSHGRDLALVATNPLSYGGTGMRTAGETALKLFSIATGKEIHRFEGRTQEMLSEFSASNDGSRFTGPNGVWITDLGVKVGFDKIALNEAEYLHQPKSAAVTENVSADGNLALVLDPTAPGFLYLFETATGKRLRTFDFRKRPLSADSDNSDGWLYSANAWFSPDGNRIYLTHYYFGPIYGSVICWDTQSGKELWHYEEFGFGRGNGEIAGHDFSTSTDASMSPDGKLIAVKNFGCERQCYGVFQIRLLNALTGRELRRFDLLTGDITGRFEGALKPFVFSHSGRYIRGVLSRDKNYDTTAYIIDTQTGTVAIYPTTEFLDQTNVFSPDDKYIIDGGQKQNYVWDASHTGATVGSTEDLGVRLLNAVTRKVEAHFEHQSPAFAAFTPDSRFILTTSNDDYDVHMWDIASQTEVRTFKGHKLSITSLGVLKSGLLVTGSMDHTQRIWDMTTGNELCRLISAANGEWAVVTPDGRFDTNKDLANVRGLHWIISDDPLTPKPLELFMRQYYEPDLLRRVLKCNADREPGKPDPCDSEFKPLPPIGEINRVQPLLQKPKALAQRAM